MINSTYTVLDGTKVIVTRHTASEVEKLTGLDAQHVSKYAHCGSIFNGRFKIVKDGDVDNYAIIFQRKWEKVQAAAELVKTGKGKIVRDRNGRKYVVEK